MSIEHHALPTPFTNACALKALRLSKAGWQIDAIAYNEGYDIEDLLGFFRGLAAGYVNFDFMLEYPEEEIETKYDPNSDPARPTAFPTVIDYPRNVPTPPTFRP